MKTEKMTECRVSNNKDSSVTMQRLVAVKTQEIDATKSKMIKYLGCFLVVATTNERELQCRCRVGNNIALSTIAQMQH